MQRIRAKYWMALCLLLLAVSGSALAQVSFSVSFGPPAIPVYEQPLCPGDGYIWTPGYWAWDQDYDDYYWVPGTWVLAPQIGYLWTPAWWGWEGGYYVFHAGYWGPHIGFYGGINYGFGYYGDGFWGGRWQGDRFYYNRQVTNVNVTNITNVYNEHVTINNNTHVSYNGGEGGVMARPTREQEEWSRERHIEAVPAQREHLQAARQNPELRAKANQGRPPIAATEKPGDFRGRVVAANAAGASYRPETRGGVGNKPTYVHPKEMPAVEHIPAPNTGNPKMDKKYQQQQEKLYAKQEQDRQKLQQKQDNEHMKLQQQHVPPERQQNVEQKHQQQTQAMMEKHTQERQQLQTKQAPPPSHKH